MNVRYACSCLLLGLMLPLVATASGQADPDPTFGDDGALIIDVDVLHEYASDLLVDSAGRYVSIGSAYDTDVNAWRGRVVRHFADGSPDPMLGPVGVRHVDWVDEDLTFRYAQQTVDGALIVLGISDSNEPNLSISIVLCRLREDGQLDPTFQEGGCRRLDKVFTQNKYVAQNLEHAGLHLLPDGKMLVLAPSFENAQDPRGFAIVRLLPDGDDDPTFGDNTSCDNPSPRCGVAFSPAQLQDAIVGSALAIDAQHRIVVGAHMNVGTFELLTAFRYSVDGDLETIFHAMNFDALTGEANTYHYAQSIQIAPNGGVFVVGTIDGSAYRIAVARWEPDGTPDIDFGNAGRVVKMFDAGHVYSTLGDFMLQSEGKLVIGGSSYDGGSTRWYCQILRLDAATGATDVAFGTDGVATPVTLNALSPGSCYVSAVARDDGHVIAAGNSYLDSNMHIGNTFLLKLGRDALFGDGFEN